MLDKLLLPVHDYSGSVLQPKLLEKYAVCRPICQGIGQTDVLKHTLRWRVPLLTGIAKHSAPKLQEALFITLSNHNGEFFLHEMAR